MFRTASLDISGSGSSDEDGMVWSDDEGDEDHSTY